MPGEDQSSPQRTSSVRSRTASPGTRQAGLGPPLRAVVARRLWHNPGWARGASPVGGARYQAITSAHGSRCTGLRTSSATNRSSWRFPRSIEGFWARDGRLELARRATPYRAPHLLRPEPRRRRRGITGRDTRRRATSLRVAPRSLLAEGAGIVLRQTPATIEMDQSLFALGFGSLMAIELKHRVEGRLGVTLPLVGLLRGPTLLEVARQLLGRLDAPRSSGSCDPSRDSAARSAGPLRRCPRSRSGLRTNRSRSAASRTGAPYRSDRIFSVHSSFASSSIIPTPRSRALAPATERKVASG